MRVNNALLSERRGSPLEQCSVVWCDTEPGPIKFLPRNKVESELKADQLPRLCFTGEL